MIILHDACARAQHRLVSTENLQGATVCEKTIFFIRHGQTNSNLTQTIQSPDEPLNTNGKQQVELLAARLARAKSKFAFTKIVSSDFLRARETAEAIAKATGVPVEYSPLFHECLHPSRIWGLNVDHPDALSTIGSLIKRYHDPLFTYEDGETFTQARNRASRALAHLLEMDDDCIAVVSHGNFCTYLFNVAIHGDAVTSEILERMPAYMGNSGIVKFTHGKYHRFSGPYVGWRLWSGDLAHLE